MGVNLLSSPHLTEDRRKLTVISPTVIHDPFGKEELLLSPCKNGILPWISFHYKQASKQGQQAHCCCTVARASLQSSAPK